MSSDSSRGENAPSNVGAGHCRQCCGRTVRDAPALRRAHVHTSHSFICGIRTVRDAPALTEHTTAHTAKLHGQPNSYPTQNELWPQGAESSRVLHEISSMQATRCDALQLSRTVERIHAFSANANTQRFTVVAWCHNSNVDRLCMHWKGVLIHYWYQEGNHRVQKGSG
jgi:hypothetical protein